MAKSFRSVLSPLLIVSYVCGLRIVEFPTGHLRPWFSLLYILLLWSIYFIFLMCTVTSYMVHYSTVYHICFGLNIFTALMSIISEVYYDKKFRNCLKRIAIMDDTLNQLGITTDYQTLHIKIICFILAWFVIAILMICGEALWLKHQYDYETIATIYVAFILNYCTQVNLMNDIIFGITLRYIGLKFDQINESVRKMAKDNEHEVKQNWENLVLDLHQRKLSKIPSTKYMIWIVIHLHLELCKISREIDSVFGMQMTLKMGLYFGLLTAGFREFFNTILINNYVHKAVEYLATIILFWIVLYVFKLLLINYVYERISIKANLTGNFINRISYTTHDIEVRENILQFFLHMTQSPLRFYGLKLFQFGYRFLHGFSTSVATVLVILIQTHTKK